MTGDVGAAGVTWSLNGTPGTPTGSSTSAVTYYAPAGLPAASSATLTATSKTDSTKTATAAITLSAPTGPASQWVYYNAAGNLTYKTISNANNAGTDGQDQIMDFSTAGYMQGGTALPTATVQATVTASGDTTGVHDTSNIQAALNTVSGLTLNTTTGLRGAVLLSAGTYYVNASLKIASSAVAPVPATNLVPPTATYQLVTTNSVINAWIRNLTALDTLQSVDIKNYSKQVTVLNVAITHTVTQTDNAKFMEFYLESATQVLMDTVSDTADNMFFFSTGSTTQGPNVLRNASFVGNTTIEPHQRWATGLLVENTAITASPINGNVGGINFYNRGDYGTGHGWTIGWGVAWNSTSGTAAAPGTDIFQQPPGSQNWCIGCMGTQAKQAAPGGSIVLPQGAIDSSGTFVFPVSLYQAQLTQRLGPGVLAQ